jgi:hypothetical protein
VIYDNASSLQAYCLNRDPAFVIDTQFRVDDNISRIDRLMDGRQAFPYPPLRFAGAVDKKSKIDSNLASSHQYFDRLSP